VRVRHTGLIKGTCADGRTNGRVKQGHASRRSGRRSELKRLRWLGWLLAGLLLLQNAVAALAAPRPNPLERHLLRDTVGAVYLYHDGLKFPIEIVDIGDG
jgi:hypothetical protein